MLQSEDELDQDLIARYTYPALDGITDVDRFYKAKYKILWILKEANWDSNQVCHLRGFHKDVTTYPNWKRTYKLVVQISHSILNGNQIPSSADEVVDVMNDIAFINVKKVAGGARSEWKVINQHYTDHKDFLHSQIEKISPNIIINCSGVWQLFSDLSDKSNCSSIKINEKGWQFNYSFNDDRLVINAYHPGQFKITQHKYFDAIAEIRKLSGR